MRSDFLRAMVLVAVVAIGCRREPAPLVDASGAPIAASAPGASASVVAEAGDARRALLDAWNAAHNAHDAHALEPLYADEVLFYRVKLPRRDCLERIRQLHTSHPSSAQTIHDVTFAPNGDATRASFVKTVVDGGKSRDYPSYLDLAPTADGLRIVTESDAITDRNIDAMACTNITWKGDWPHTTDDVELTGRVARETTYFSLTLDKAICLPPDSTFSQATQTTRLQAILPDGDALVGKHVRVKGDLFLAHTAHHFEPALIDAKTATTIP